MKDFLEFLNSANALALQKTRGVSLALAERIIAARPFENPADSLRVSGLGENLLQRLQNNFDEMDNPMSEETSLAPASQISSESSERAESPSQSALLLRPEPVEEPRPAAKPKPNFGQRLWRAFVGFLKFLFTLFIIAVILGGIGAGLYFGLPYLHQVYVVPVNQNTARIADVAHQQARDVLALQAEIATLQTELANLQERDTQFETQLAAIGTSIEAHTTTLSQLDEMQSKLDLAADQEREGLSAELSRQIELTRAIELLSRARLYLSQSNFGQARQDVLLARDLLAVVREDVPETERAALDAALFRLDLVLSNLPGFPVIAVDDLNIAWNLLVLGASEPAPTETP
ncbi:MAG TPA: hypothetical protein DCG54_11060 [Anaerolineae bacterium]|jgi:hypothetical protein|nr:hypothetical protein [Anaerolineae bacterium]